MAGVDRLLWQRRVTYVRRSQLAVTHQQSANIGKQRRSRSTHRNSRLLPSQVKFNSSASQFAPPAPPEALDGTKAFNVSSPHKRGHHCSEIAPPSHAGPIGATSRCGRAAENARGPQRWGMSKTHANRQIDAASVAEVLTPMGVKPSERVARELAPLRFPELGGVHVNWPTVVVLDPEYGALDDGTSRYTVDAGDSSRA
jgi:hypothetical protein